MQPGDIARDNKRKRGANGSALNDETHYEVEAIDLTDEDNTPRKMPRVSLPRTSSAISTVNQAIPFSLSGPSTLNVSANSVLGPLASPSARNVEKERLKLQLQEIEIKRRLLELEDGES